MQTARSNLRGFFCTAFVQLHHLVEFQGLFLICIPVKQRRQNVHVDLVQFRRAMTTPEVLRMWDNKARVARTEGVEAHRQIEMHFTTPGGGPVPTGSPPAVAQAFVDMHLASWGAKIVASEYYVFDEASSVVATIDAVVQFPSGAFGLIDWKHTTALETRMTECASCGSHTSGSTEM